MGRGVDSLLTFGYFGILGLFVGMIILCFFWGLWEYKKPKDPGPLFIDLDRTIKKRLRERSHSVNTEPLCNQSADSGKTFTLPQSRDLSRISAVNETIRVRGDLRIPKGEVVPYNMIVEGNLISQEDVTFQGGLHVKGRAVIGARNRLEKSIVCKKDLLISEDVTVYNCIDCEGIVFIKDGARVGVGMDGGGIASARNVYLESAEGPLRIQSRDGVRIVGNLKEVIPDNLRQTIEVKAK